MPVVLLLLLLAFAPIGPSHPLPTFHNENVAEVANNLSSPKWRAIEGVQVIVHSMELHTRCLPKIVLASLFGLFARTENREGVLMDGDGALEIAKKQAAEYYALAESEGFFSHFAAYNEQILRPLKNAGEFTTEGAKQEIIATLMLQPRDLRNGFVLYNVLAFLFGVAEAFTSMALGHGPWSLIWNGGAGYCIAYTLYWTFLCKQAKVCVQVASRRVRTHPARSLCRPPA